MVGRLHLTDQGLSFSALVQETVSGGQLVKAVSGATVLTSGNALDNVIEVMKCDAAGDASFVVGIAETTATSGNRVTVTGRGIHGLYAAETINAGSFVYAADGVTSADAVAQDGGTGDSGQSLIIGKALSTAASGQLATVQLLL